MIVEYKCRRCGIIHTPIGGNKETVLSCLVHLVTDTPHESSITMSPTLLHLHCCEDKGYGISDIIGAKKDIYDNE